MNCPECGSRLRIDAWAGMALHLECQNPATYSISKKTVCGWTLPLYGPGMEAWILTQMDEFIAGLPQEKLLEATAAKKARTEKRRRNEAGYHG